MVLNLHYADHKRRYKTYSCKTDYVWQRKAPVLIVHKVIPFVIRRLPPGYPFGEFGIIFQLIFITKQSILFLSTILRTKL